MHEPSTALLAGFCVLGVVTSYLHYFGLLFVVELLACLFALGLLRGIPLRVALAPAVCISLSYVPWLSIMRAQAANNGAWMREPTGAHVWQTLESMASGHAVLSLLLLAIGASLVLARRQTSRWQTNAGPVVLVLAWAVIPAVSALAISSLIVPVYSIRNLIIVLPACLLLLALALEQLDRLLGGRSWSLILVCALLLADLVFARRYYTAQTKEPLREIAAQIANDSRTGEAPSVLTEPDWFGAFLDQCFVLNGSPLHRSGLDQPPKDELWVVARKRALPAVPDGYEPRSIRVYQAQAIDLLRPWQITVAHYRRSVVTPGSDTAP